MPDLHTPPVFDDAFRRLAKLQGGDPAFFVLAVHSFMEGALRSTFTLADPADDRFTSFLEEFRSHVLSKATAYIPGLDVLGLIKQQHYLTNDVRHRFAPASVEEARAATQHLCRFCALAEIPEGGGLAAVKACLNAWDDRRSHADLLREVNELGYRYQVERKTGKEMSERVASLEASLATVGMLKEEIRAKDRAIAELQEIKGKKDAKVDELRAERATLAGELRAAKLKADAYDDARAYIDELSRLTILTRTRADYEKTIIRLTPEQKKVLEQIHLDSDFLVKGAAGTGKTLVLLKAIEKALAGGRQPELGMDEIKGSIVLLTYTNTLVKYDRYIASLIAVDPEENLVSTADRYLIERMKELDPSLTLEYGIAEELAGRFPAAGLSPKDLSAEIEGFIWGNDISYREYVEEGVERRGMRRPLNKEQREAVWTSLEAMDTAMVEKKTLSKNRAALFVAAGASEEGLGKVRKTDYVFVDEAQDLSAALIKALKECSRRCLILAGDADQSIYQPGFSFRRSGVDIGGRTRILKVNFRNSVAVHAAAERFRALCPGLDGESLPEAFRDGPAPELYKGDDQADMLDLLLKRIELFVRRLDYDPDNLCVIVPTNSDVELVSRYLSDAGLSVSDVRDKDFSFSERGSIRISTMHSVKGLDFPVVLLFIPKYHLGDPTADAGASERMARNLVYVAMTRAMDHLNVFVRKDTENGVIKDLAACIAPSQP